MCRMRDQGIDAHLGAVRTLDNTYWAHWCAFHTLQYIFGTLRCIPHFAIHIWHSAQWSMNWPATRGGAKFELLRALNNIVPLLPPAVYFHCLDLMLLNSIVLPTYCVLSSVFVSVCVSFPCVYVWLCLCVWNVHVCLQQHCPAAPSCAFPLSRFDAPQQNCIAHISWSLIRVCICVCEFSVCLCVTVSMCMKYACVPSTTLSRCSLLLASIVLIWCSSTESYCTHIVFSYPLCPCLCVYVCLCGILLLYTPID